MLKQILGGHQVKDGEDARRWAITRTDIIREQTSSSHDIVKALVMACAVLTSRGTAALLINCEMFLLRLEKRPKINALQTEICALVGNYAAYSGNFLLAFWDNP